MSKTIAERATDRDTTQAVTRDDFHFSQAETLGSPSSRSDSEDGLIELEPIDETPEESMLNMRDEWPWLFDRNDRAAAASSEGHGINDDGEQAASIRNAAANEVDHVEADDLILSQEPVSLCRAAASEPSTFNGRRPMPALPAQGEITRMALGAARSDRSELRGLTIAQPGKKQTASAHHDEEEFEPPKLTPFEHTPTDRTDPPNLSVTEEDADVSISVDAPTMEDSAEDSETIDFSTSAEDRPRPAGTSKPPPRKIGRGRLVKERLTWKPGDPFADGTPPTQRRFRWEVMLTAACGTALCGMGGIWLVRMIFAP